MTASYPYKIKTFQTFQDFEDINYAEHLNEVHDEIIAIETTLGVNPFLNLPTSYVSLNAALTDLFENKAPLTHIHKHSSLSGDATGNDHPQYALLTGANFVGPVTAPPAATKTQAVNLAQLQAQGFADEQAVQGEINTQLASRCRGAPSGSVSLFGRATQYGWTLIGGYNEGDTNTSGQLTWTFGAGAFASVNQAMAVVKANTGLGSAPFPDSYFPFPPYDPTTVDLTLAGANLNSGTVQFNYKSTGLPLIGHHVAFTWVSIGV